MFCGIFKTEACYKRWRVWQLDVNTLAEQRAQFQELKEKAMSLASEFAWCNGEIKNREAGAPSVASISFHLGTGVFDGMMAYWNRDHYYIHRAEAHLVR